MMRVLLTGASGFLGSHLAKALLARGDEVLALRRPASDLWRLESVRDRIRWFDVGNFHPAFEAQPSAVIHAAAVYGRGNSSASQILRTNVIFSVELYEAAVEHGVPLFINTASALERNVSPYSLSKAQSAEWLERLGGGVRLKNVLLQHMYGADDDESKFTTFLLKQCLADVPDIPLSPGTQRRDFIHVDDAVSGYLTLLDGAEKIEATEVELGSGDTVTIREFAELVRDLCGASTRLNFGAVPLRPNEPAVCVADPVALRRLGWSPAYSLDSGLMNVINELKAL